MPQIERPTYRLPLRDLPLSLFIHPTSSSSAHTAASLLGKKRPISPSSIVSPSKRRLLAVEGVLSPRSPFKKAVNDLKHALPSVNSPARNLLVEFQHAKPVFVDKGDIYAPTSKGRQPSFLLEVLSNTGDTGIGGGGIRMRGERLMKPPVAKATKSLLAPEAEIGAHQPKPRVAAAPSKAEVELLKVLESAPRPTMEFLPGAGSPRAMRSKEEDPEEVHYPGFDIYADEEGDEEGEDVQQQVERGHMDAEDEDEDEQEASKENQAPYVSRCHNLRSGIDLGWAFFHRTPSGLRHLLSARRAVCRPLVLHVANSARLEIVSKPKWTGTHSVMTTIFFKIRRARMAPARHCSPFQYTVSSPQSPLQR